jgi:RimJ/RimL family protein N-acetyltransferase
VETDVRLRPVVAADLTTIYRLTSDPEATGEHEWFRGRGHGTQAHRELVRYLFMHTQVNRIEAGTEVTNLAGQRTLEKAGFTREGVMRGAAFQGGRWRDGPVYSVLRSEVEF